MNVGNAIRPASSIRPNPFVAISSFNFETSFLYTVCTASTIRSTKAARTTSIGFGSAEEAGPAAASVVGAAAVADIKFNRVL